MSLEDPNEKKPTVRKTKWTLEEDALLEEGILLYGKNKWTKIAKRIPSRSPKQCRERWTGQIDPDLHHDSFTKDEDEKLKRLHKEYGNSWTKIAKFMPGRCPNMVKNRYRVLEKRIKEPQIRQIAFNASSPVIKPDPKKIDYPDIFTFSFPDMLENEEWI